MMVKIITIVGTVERYSIHLSLLCLVLSGLTGVFYFAAYQVIHRLSPECGPDVKLKSRRFYMFCGSRILTCLLVLKTFLCRCYL